MPKIGGPSRMLIRSNHFRPHWKSGELTPSSQYRMTKPVSSGYLSLVDASVIRINTPKQTWLLALGFTTPAPSLSIALSY